MKWVEVSISWPQLQTKFTKSWKLCLNLWSDKWLNPSLTLVRNFNPSLLSKLSTWLGSGLMNFSTTFLKSLQESRLRILTSILLHSIITARKKEFLKKFVFALKKVIWLFWTLLVVQGMLFSGVSWKRSAGDFSFLIHKTGIIFSNSILSLGFSDLLPEKGSQMMFPNCSNYCNCSAILKRYKTVAEQFVKGSIVGYTTIIWLWPDKWFIDCHQFEVFSKDQCSCLL